MHAVPGIDGTVDQPIGSVEQDGELASRPFATLSYKDNVT